MTIQSRLNKDTVQLIKIATVLILLENKMNVVIRKL